MNHERLLDLGEVCAPLQQQKDALVATRVRYESELRALEEMGEIHEAEFDQARDGARTMLRQESFEDMRGWHIRFQEVRKALAALNPERRYIASEYNQLPALRVASDARGSLFLSLHYGAKDPSLPDDAHYDSYVREEYISALYSWLGADTEQDTKRAIDVLTVTVSRKGQNGIHTGLYDRVRGIYGRGFVSSQNLEDIEVIDAELLPEVEDSLELYIAAFDKLTPGQASEKGFSPESIETLTYVHSLTTDEMITHGFPSAIVDRSRGL